MCMHVYVCVFVCVCVCVFQRVSVCVRVFVFVTLCVVDPMVSNQEPFLRVFLPLKFFFLFCTAFSKYASSINGHW